MKSLRYHRPYRVCRFAALSLTLIAAICTNRLEAGKPVRYELLVLAPPGIDISWGSASDVDENGNVVGHYEVRINNESQSSAFFYDSTAKVMHTLSDGAYAASLNSSGAIVGSSSTRPYGLYWSQHNAVPLVFKPLTDNGLTGVKHINNAGLAVGTSYDDGNWNPVIWWAVGNTVTPPKQLPPLPGYAHAIPREISEFSEFGIAWVVGTAYSDTDTDLGRAVLWPVTIDSNGNLECYESIDLEALSGEYSEGAGVNRNGDTCGISGFHFPFLKLAGQPMDGLPTPRRTRTAYVSSINESADVVGGVTFEPKRFGELGESRAFLWSEGRGVDLNSRVSIGGSDFLESASAISQNGHIAGAGRFLDVSAGQVPYVLIRN